MFWSTSIPHSQIGCLTFPERYSGYNGVYFAEGAAEDAAFDHFDAALPTDVLVVAGREGKVL